MIYTRFGSPVEIIEVIPPDNPSHYPSWVVIKYLDRAGQREVHISDLKATDSHEITDPLERWLTALETGETVREAVAS